MSKKKWYDYLWIFGVFSYHVWGNALEYIFSVCRGTGFKTSGYAIVDIQGSLALGISWYIFISRCRSVCFWFL